jgi:beta-lactam-binding protein with PASTA domain
VTTPMILGERYEVGESIGHGGMAEVHAGQDTRLGRTVAIKMMRADMARDATFLARFRREAQSAASLNHPSIVAVYDSGEEHTTDERGRPETLPYIVMEFVSGRTLRDVLNQSTGATMDPIRAMRVTEGILTALEYSHHHGIVHRDIKPANVMVTEDGDIKVMDFGIARAIADSGATVTQTQAVIGTAQYLSPEQARGETVDARSDLYSTACLLYELLTGRPPFVGDSAVSIAYQHVGESPQPPSLHRPSVPPDLDAVTLHAMSKDRDDRYQSAEEFRDDLVAARTGRPISEAARGTAERLAGGAGAAGEHRTMTITRAGGGTTLVDGSTERIRGTGTGRRPSRAGAHATNTATLPPIGHDPADDPRRRHAGSYLLLILAVLAALVVIGFAARAVLTGSSGTAKVGVPNVVKMTRTQALKVLQAKQLKTSVDTVVSSTAPKDTVVDQDPRAGSNVSPATTVTIRVSSGPGQVGVPDVRGFPLASAKQTLTDVGLKVAKVQSVDDASVAKGAVVSTDPSAATVVDGGSAVVVKVSSGKVVVPNVVGSDRSDAVTTLSGLGLHATISFASSSAAEGTVLKQTHQGDKVPSGTEIALVIAQTAPPTTTATSTPPPTSSSTRPTSSTSSTSRSTTKTSSSTSTTSSTSSSSSSSSTTSTTSSSS